MPAYPESVILEYITLYITEDYNISPDRCWININSVFTRDDKYRMGFNIDKNFVHDFKLGESWPIEKFVEVYQDVNTTEAKNILMRIYFKHLKNGIKIQSPVSKIIPAISLDEVKMKPIMKNLNEKDVLRNKIGRQAVRYLINRGFNINHINKFNLKYSDQWECYKCEGSGKDEEDEECVVCKGSGKNPYYGWLIIPSYENGKLVYYQGRNLDKQNTFRYRNPHGLAKSQVVLFYDQLIEGEDIFITEGPMDAMTLIDYSVCCIMGNRISEPQAQKILNKNPKSIIFIPDRDETEEKRIMIKKALDRNFETFKKFGYKGSNLGIYKWYNKHKGKDINEASITKIDRELIVMRSFKEEILERLKGEN